MVSLLLVTDISLQDLQHGIKLLIALHKAGCCSKASDRLSEIIKMLT